MRPITERDLMPDAKCDYCGQPGEVETQMYGSRYNMGRVICEDCKEGNIYKKLWKEQQSEPEANKD